MGREQQNWYMMQLKHDFSEKLKKYGQLPVSNIESKFIMLDKLN